MKSRKIHGMAAAAVMTALLCVLAPLSVPVGPVPLTFANLALYLAVFLLGRTRGTVSYLVYLCIGLVGMPVFSGFAGGLGHLLGPTGGYLLGWLPAAFLMGTLMGRSRASCFGAMAAGTALCYALGTARFCAVTDTAVWAALGICVLPFLPGDLLKMAAVLAVGPALRQKLAQAGALSWEKK